MTEELNIIAKKLSSPPKGILAADESTNTIKKRFDTIGLESTFENRRRYREILFTSDKLTDYISGIILYDETIKQSTSEGVPFPEFLKKNNILSGIKVDTGAIPILSKSSEKITEGLDGLAQRLDEYKNLGAKFTKWRAIIEIGDSSPSDYTIKTNSFVLARYAKVVQDHGLVPIVEPEVLMDGSHTIDDCYKITKKTLLNVFEELKSHGVFLGGILLKPNMVISGKKCSNQATITEVSKYTIKCLEETVPHDVPGIVFLSGGQNNEIATQHLNEMNKNNDLPWNLSFSYGRALQQPSISLWKGLEENISISQNALIKRCKLNSEATTGNYSIDSENSL
tara:strand:+ start:3152 stop:4168 length:1017 start_codon:yes stop_codon:yes gene_type:complete